jgi:hypothetical protein
MPSNEIPLSHAPEAFFDQEKWNRFVAYFVNRQDALEHISQPEPGALTFYRQKAAQLTTFGGLSARQQQEIHLLGESLVADFKSRLIRGEIIATGFSGISVERSRIPPDRWQNIKMWPHFINEQTTDGQLEFTVVRVSDVVPTTTSAIDLLQRCIEWMQQRRDGGESRRKVLEKEALKHFGTAIKIRTFAEAYRVVFNKPRGRPRLTKK